MNSSLIDLLSDTLVKNCDTLESRLLAEDEGEGRGLLCEEVLCLARRRRRRPKAAVEKPKHFGMTVQLEILEGRRGERKGSASSTPSCQQCFLVADSQSSQSYLLQEIQLRRPLRPAAAAAAAPARPGDVDRELRRVSSAAAVRVPLRVVQRPVGRGHDRRLVDAALGQQAQAARVVPHLGGGRALEQCES